MKVIPGEECVEQQHLVACDIAVHIPAKRKRKFAPSICTWKLRDPAVASHFHEVFKENVSTATTSDSYSPVEDE